MASIFTKILNGELSCYKVYEDELCFAFLALDQVNLGHTLVVPKCEVDHWFEVPTDSYLAVQKAAKLLAPAIRTASKAPRIGVMVAGFEVPHYHVHLIPAWSIPDLDFKRAKRRSETEMKEIQSSIVKILASSH